MTPMIALFIGAVLNQEKLSMMVMLGAVVLLSGLFVYFYKDLQASRKLAQKLKSQN
jgi:drug/metabolite transporter (DMT)-like permease